MECDLLDGNATPCHGRTYADGRRSAKNNFTNFIIGPCICSSDWDLFGWGVQTPIGTSTVSEERLAKQWRDLRRMRFNN